MTPDRDEHHLLDGCLDEVLAGRTPPDLTARIMQAHAARGPVLHSNRPIPLGPPSVAASNGALHAAPANGQPVVERALRRNRSTSTWSTVATVAGGVGILAFIGMLIVSSDPQPEVVKKPGTKTPGPAVVKNNDTVPQPRDLVVPNLNPRPSPSPAPLVVTPKPPLNDPPQIASHAPPTAPQPAPIPQPKYLDPAPSREVISFVNASLTHAWTENGVTPSPVATDAEWCRRLFVRVIGRIPTAEELKTFTSDRSPNKREQLVDRLLTDENYVEEYARHWATIWSNVLVGRTGGSAESLADREGLEQYLRQSLAKNKPYDQLVRELLTATGTSKPGTEGYNGAVNFLLAGLSKDATLATARVSRVFLGRQLQCAQCHKHPEQDWPQEQFWSLNAFFRQMRAEKAGAGMRLVNVDFSGEGQNSTEGEVFYETPTGLLKTAFPAFLDGTKVPPSGQLAEVDRRAELARLVAASPEMPRALVNRVWAHFFGYGFTQPVDDIGPQNPPSNPELFDRLSEQFAAHHFDLKDLIRWIALSDAFGRSSKLTTLASKDMPEAGAVALFSRYYSRQMQAEEVYNSLVHAAQIRKTASNAADIEKARVDWLAQFSRQMGTDAADEESHFNGSMRQSLIMMNGDLMRRAASSKSEGLLKSVAGSSLKFEDKVQHLFLSALSREPNKKELDAARTILKNSAGDQAVALEDIWWALLNSNEFILDH